jgi:hypothetical protein
MASLSETTYTAEELRPDVSHLVTEDDTPVDNIFSEKQQRLLTEPLYAAWQPLTPATQQPRLFVALANVGLYYGLHYPPLVPDAMISLDAQPAHNLWEKHNRTYMVWEFGKPPEVAIEIISNLKGEELGSKMERYLQAQVMYYVVFDPSAQYGETSLRIFRKNGNYYKPVESIDAEEFPLQLALWHGEYEGHEAEWLRWADHEGNLIPTGKERAEREQQRAEREQQRAEREQQRAEREQQRAKEAESALLQEREARERFAAKLRTLGINPDEI